MKTLAIIGAIGGLIIGIFIGVHWMAPLLEEGRTAATAESGGATQPAATPAVEKEATIKWRMASTFPSSLAILGTSGKRFERKIDLVSNGGIQFRFFEPGALVPALELFDAVSAGSVEAGWSTAGYWAGKIPAAQFFTTVPFGPKLPEALAWLYFGGGLELWRELYAPYNVYPIPCFMNAAEGSGWFREPIETLDDLKGLKMRFFGLGARVMEKLGVSTQLLAGGDIYPALELGTIDATEFSMPVIDEDLGFDQIAKNYYFPGWHQPDSIGELIINLELWNTLSEHQKALIETTCGENLYYEVAESAASQFDPLRRMQDNGVTLHRWPDSFLDAFRSAWEEVSAEEAAKDPDYKRVLDSLTEFRENYAIWRNLSAIPDR